MQEEELFNSGKVIITRKLARFGGTSYAISNISLVRLGFSKRASPLAVILGFFGAAALLVGLNSPPGETQTVMMILGLAAVLGAILCQALWPRKEFSFVLKSNSGDIESFTINDRNFAIKVKSAIEDAIALRA